MNGNGTELQQVLPAHIEHRTTAVGRERLVHLRNPNPRLPKIYFHFSGSSPRYYSFTFATFRITVHIAMKSNRNLALWYVTIHFRSQHGVY